MLTCSLNRISHLNMAGNPDSAGIWAPCLTYSDNKFWLVYNNAKSGGRIFKNTSNYLVTCDHIDGEWSEPIDLNSSGCDPSLFHNDDGKKYLINMVWDHRESNHPFYGIVLQEYSNEDQRLVGRPHLIFKGSGLGETEGPHLYKHGGYYYLLMVEGGTGYEHAVTIARSKELMGPYEMHPDNPILTLIHDLDNPIQKAGHASLVESQKGSWFLVHLCGRPIETRGNCLLGCETCIQRVEWKDEWPYVENGRLPSASIEVDEFEEYTFADSWPGTDDFNEETLNIHYQTPRVPWNRSMSLTERAGHLRLYGGKSLACSFDQTHIARRWQSLEFEAEVKMDFRPESFQQMAGMTMFYNQKNWLFFNVTFDEVKGRVLQLSHMDSGIVYKECFKNENFICVPQNVEYVFLKTRVHGSQMNFQYSFDGKTYCDILGEFYVGQLSDDFARKTSHLDEFFTGAFVGMACVDLAGMRKTADFDYFRYSEV